MCDGDDIGGMGSGVSSVNFLSEIEVYRCLRAIQGWTVCILEYSKCGGLEKTSGRTL